MGLTSGRVRASRVGISPGIAGALGLCLAMLLWAGFALVSAGLRSAAVAAPSWWLLSAFAYTVVPTGAGALNDQGNSTLRLFVSEQAMSEYLLYVGAVTLALALGWRSGYGSSTDNGTLQTEVSFPIRRVWATILLSVLAYFASAVLSGVSPRQMLLTVNDRGMSFYDGVYEFSALRSLAMAMLILVPALLVYAGRGQPWTGSKLLVSLPLYLLSGMIVLLAGIRANLVLFLLASISALVVHPRVARDSLARHVRRLVAIGIVAAAFYPVALWMQNSRSITRRTGSMLLGADPVGMLDLATPSAALFQWARAWGLSYGVSLRDVVQQAPPSFIVPMTERAQFLQIVDSMNVQGAGAAVSSAAELFLNAGWVLGPMVMFCLGAALGRYQVRIERRKDMFSLLILLTLGPAFAQIFTRGYLWQSLFALMSVFAAAWVVARILGGSQPRPKSASAAQLARTG
jgi:hypothetical protein